MTGNNKDSNRIHIILDTSKVNRCAWCGSPVSDHWISEEGGSYCSEECLKEWYKDRNSGFFCFSGGLLIFLLPILLAYWLTDSLFIDAALRFQVIAFGSIGAVLLFILTVSSYREYKHGADIPRNSRRSLGTTERSLLRTISTPVECPKCGAKIDLTNIGDDMVYYCQYCGANGTIEIKMVE